MQAVSDHFYWIILALATFHAIGFVVLFRARNTRVRQLESHLANLVGVLSRRSDEDPTHTIDERIDSFITDIREVLQHPHSVAEVQRLYDRIVSKDELRRYLQGTKFETWYNVARTGIEIYPLLGIVGTVLAIGLGLNTPASAPAGNPASSTNMVAPPGSGAAASAEPSMSSSTGAIVKNFASSIWATLTGLVCAIIFMMCNAYLEPGFTRLIDHRTNVRNVISHAKSQLGLATRAELGEETAERVV